MNDKEFQNSERQRNIILCNLIKQDINNGKFLSARERLKNIQSDSEVFKLLWGLLENVEYNFEKSKYYYRQCLANVRTQRRALLRLAKLHIQTGDYEIAKKMLETSQLETNFYVQATFGLICIYILEGDYEKAYYYLKSIDTEMLNAKTLYHYRKMEIFLLYRLGKIQRTDVKFNLRKDYFVPRLFDDNEEDLLQHISRHKNQERKDDIGCFFEDLDLRKLLVEARKRIKNMNANHFEMSDTYKFSLDTPIGYNGNGVIRDLCVATIIGTKDIITMYPVKLSDEFDKEGMSMSKQLYIKRLQGEAKK